MMNRRGAYLLSAAAALMLVILACNGTIEQPAAEAPLPTAANLEPVVRPTETGFSDGTQPTALSPAIPERRRVSLEFPPAIRAGDSDVIRLTLEMDDLGGITPTAEVEGNVITGKTVEIPNLYETHNVTAEARAGHGGGGSAATGDDQLATGTGHAGNVLLERESRNPRGRSRERPG